MLSPFDVSALETTRDTLRQSGVELPIEDPRPWLDATGCEKRAFALEPARGLLRLAALTAFWRFDLLPTLSQGTLRQPQARVAMPLWTRVEPLLDDILEGRWPCEPIPREGESTSAVLLMIALAARRLAQAPEHVAPFASKQAAVDALEHLDALFGKGLFAESIFWMLGALADMGLVSQTDAAPYRAVPTRAAREALFRLGFIDSPYAQSLQALIEASSILSHIYSSPRGDLRLLAFVREQGCASPCIKRHRCPIACREHDER